MAEALSETLDDELYPTDETLRIVREWKGSHADLLAAVKTVWKYADCGYWWEEDAKDSIFPEMPIRRYHVSTVGWSGNESLISALEENRFFWMLNWVQSRRGGHYIFELKKASSGDADRG